MISTSVRVALAAFGMIAIAILMPGSPAAAGSSALAKDKRTVLEAAWPFAADQRWQTYRRIDALFERLWRKPEGVATVRKGTVRTFESLPQLELEDRDKDGQAEFFVYVPASGPKETQEFGAYFDLSGDGRPDWIVYYGGLMMTKAMKLYSWHHHAVDVDGDGRFDLRIYRLVDKDGDAVPEQWATAWLYDTDNDGLVDRAEWIEDGVIRPIVPDGEGRLALRYTLAQEPERQPRIGRPMPIELFQSVAADIAALPGS